MLQYVMEQQQEQQQQEGQGSPFLNAQQLFISS
jgi:hypothetical protein